MTSVDKLSEHFISPDTRLNVRGRQNISLIPTLVQELLKFFVGAVGGGGRLKALSCGIGLKNSFTILWLLSCVPGLLPVVTKRKMHNLRKSENFLCTRK